MMGEYCSLPQVFAVFQREEGAVPIRSAILLESHPSYMHVLVTPLATQGMISVQPLLYQAVYSAPSYVRFPFTL